MRNFFMFFEERCFSFDIQTFRDLKHPQTPFDVIDRYIYIYNEIT